MVSSGKYVAHVERIVAGQHADICALPFTLISFIKQCPYSPQIKQAKKEKRKKKSEESFLFLIQSDTIGGHY